ncbi:hypothetical protein NGRA_3062 [Nosema granulosis]|uniref:Uncharacterized protein n=1 Tax=Nosema granulosis TaxID=83296 RepID=A0A9P6GVG0_9MICR|nr:hypothetical protein NGRA_3062 [Nosema granulosis]
MIKQNYLQSSLKHDNLISESRNSRTLTLRGPQYLLQPEQARKIEQTFEKVRFTINLGEDSGIEAPQRIIHVFTDHDVQDVLSWTQSVRKLAVLNSWTPDLANKILDILISDKYKEGIADKRTLDTKLDALCDTVFSLDDYSLYRNLIASAQRSNHPNVTAYIQYLEDLKIRADMCCKSNEDKLPDREILDKIISTLSQREKECLIFNEASTLSEIKHVLHKMSTMENFYQINNRSVATRTTASTTTPNIQKYCSYHKSNYHNTSECRAKSEGKLNNQTQKKPF